ncbi:TPA: hypothetical protein QDB05_000217 [Burkholderia vietnamiensis]|nr:hypothetical protein [Burkholderia vietnamiensis]
MGILKTIISKIASWFGMELQAVEQKATAVVSEIKVDLATDAGDAASQVAKLITARCLGTDAPAARVAAPIYPQPGVSMNVNTAIQIALALKAIDPNLSADAVQAATNAALSAAYPAPAAAAPAPVPAA